jgi:hypothetical protein
VYPVEFIVISVAHPFQDCFEQPVAVFIIGCLEEVETASITKILGKFVCE